MSDTEFWLDLEPADALFFRDHGSRRAGVDNWSSSVSPSPLTLFGAIGSYLLEGLGVDFAKFKKKEEAHVLLGNFDAKLRGLPWSIAGPFLGKKGTIYLPAPASSYFNKEQDEYSWLIPLKERGLLSRLPEELRPLVFADGQTVSGKDVKPAQGWIEDAALERFLQNGMPSSFSHEEEKQFFCAEKRCGIGIDKDFFAAEDGMFFVTSMMRVKQEWNKDTRTLRQHVFSMQVRFSQPARAQVEEIISKNSGAFFGGELGRVKVSIRSREPVIEAPEPSVLAEQGRFLLYLCTPALFEEGWRPRCWPACFSGAELIGAAVHKPCRISGWMQGQGPRRLFHAAPGGSVYYFETPGWGKDKFATLIKEYHLNKSISGYYPCAGFGITCIGTWNEGGSHAA